MCGTYCVDFQLTCYSCSFTLALSLFEVLESFYLANKLLEKTSTCDHFLAKIAWSTSEPGID